ncbi:hypothetical protein GA0116948_101626 [Chitinophaga costaii]|uniref:Uncharacterized protein n=1 Tax=Chitinophaga costaii TaxID=1335309 RepID=A0A1C4A006_9BACT|nr:hypothetical protein [Chitinophaga costaii]PUZ30572.1 hypothetical protein DCM91_03665 [Chitinophaga costaii]SCB87780.1 hypothetical protein GA0116948_101626 [Chitinophaga costaii]
MEKINALIDKLQELKNSNAGLQNIAYHTQLLQSEIFRAQLASPNIYANTSSNIAVILPASRTQAAMTEPAFSEKSATWAAPAAAKAEKASTATIVVMPAAKATDGETNYVPATSTSPAATVATPTPAPAIPAADEQRTDTAQPVPAPPVPETPAETIAAQAEQAPAAAEDIAIHPTPGVIPAAAHSAREMQAEKPSERAFVTVTTDDLQPAQEAPNKPSPFLQETASYGHSSANRPKTIVGNNGVPGNTLFDTPSPTQGNAGMRDELQELAGKNMTSLNDRLRSAKIELGDKLGDTHVSDLRQAIGINDKFQFIQELFRGDVDMYERSVRTINEFRSYQEADLWIQRELTIKLGWQDDYGPVQHFYGLLKKRFSAI